MSGASTLIWPPLPAYRGQRPIAGRKMQSLFLKIAATSRCQSSLGVTSQTVSELRIYRAACRSSLPHTRLAKSIYRWTRTRTRTLTSECAKRCCCGPCPSPLASISRNARARCQAVFFSVAPTRHYQAGDSRHQNDSCYQEVENSRGFAFGNDLSPGPGLATSHPSALFGPPMRSSFHGSVFSSSKSRKTGYTSSWHGDDSLFAGFVAYCFISLSVWWTH